jgi:hypothetical protein
MKIVKIFQYHSKAIMKKMKTFNMKMMPICQNVNTKSTLVGKKIQNDAIFMPRVLFVIEK